MNRIHFSEFSEAEYRKWVRYVRRLIANTSDMDAEDFVQDVLLSILSRADFNEPLENAAGYVFQALRNRVTDYFRRRRQKPASLETAAPGETGLTLKEMLSDNRIDIAADMESREWRDELLEAIRQLSPEEQAVVIATEFEGEKYQALAEAWEVPLNTLLSRKARALKKLGLRLSAWNQT